MTPSTSERIIDSVIPSISCQCKESSIDEIMTLSIHIDRIVHVVIIIHIVYIVRIVRIFYIVYIVYIVHIVYTVCMISCLTWNHA